MNTKFRKWAVAAGFALSAGVAYGFSGSDPTPDEIRGMTEQQKIEWIAARLAVIEYEPGGRLFGIRKDMVTWLDRVGNSGMVPAIMMGADGSSYPGSENYKVVFSCVGRLVFLAPGGGVESVVIKEPGAGKVLAAVCRR